MGRASTGQAVSGAAQGAVAGSVFGPFGIAAGAGLGFVGGLISGGSSDAQFKNQLAWSEYNRQSQYNTDIYNINASLGIAGMNAALGVMAGNYNAQQVLNVAAYNANIIELTTNYNEELLDNELVRVWQDLDLDITQIEMFRARERGNIVVDQAASGSVIGQDSNAEVVIMQQTAEAMDINIVEFGADRQAANIANQIAQGRWQGDVAIQQTMWEGQVQASSIQFNSRIQAFGTVASAVIQADANMYTSKQNFMTAGYNNQNAAWANSQQNTQNMIGGLFSAAASGASAYYAAKIPSTSGKTASTAGGNSLSPSNYSSKFGGSVYLGKSAPPTSAKLLTGGLGA